jgi:hypothetical protein
MITPHFPPDSNAGTHRVRLLAPHLPRHGWLPTVLTVDPAYYEGVLDPRLLELVPPTLHVERVKAIPARVVRPFGVGDLGLRSLGGLYSRAAELLRREKYDALFVTIYPAYTALLGPMLKRRFPIPFVLDYQDPWVGSWGKTVGARDDRGADLKSRISRFIATRLEPRAVRAADAITAVSSKTIEEVVERNPDAGRLPSLTIPVGGDVSDFDALRKRPAKNGFFDPDDGLFHLCYVGTLLPLGVETLRAVLSGIAAIRDSRPDIYSRLRLHFIGTSNERRDGAAPRVRGLAEELGVGGIVSEEPMRIDYTDALTVQVQASALLLMGSSEHHYTASKLYPAMLAQRPVLAVYHRASSVSSILGSHSGELIRLVQFGDHDPAGHHSAEIADAVVSLVERSGDVHETGASSMDDSLAAANIAGALANLLDNVSGPAMKGEH